MHDAVPQAEVTDLVIKYNVRSDGKNPNIHYWNEVLNQTVDVSRASDRNGNPVVVNEVATAGSLMSYNAKQTRSVRRANNQKDMQIVHGQSGDLLTLRESGLTPNPSKRKDTTNRWRNLYKATTQISGSGEKEKNIKAEITGYITYDVKTHKVSQIGEVWVIYTDPLTNSTTSKRLTVEGTLEKVRIIINHDDSSKLYASYIDITTTKLTEAPNKTTYVVKYEGQGIFPPVLLTMSHYWSSFMLPLDE